MTLLSMLDRFEQAAVTYETSTAKADRDELHAARRAIMEAFEAPRFPGAAMSGSELTARDRLALIIGQFPLHTDNRGDDNQVLHDAFSGGYDARTEAVYQLVDELLAEISALSAAPQPAPAVGEREAEAERYAERLATVLWEKHWKADSPQWKPLSGDLIGILTQIDNMTAGLTRSGAEREAELVKALEDTLWCLEQREKMANPEWDGSATETSAVGKARAALRSPQQNT